MIEEERFNYHLSETELKEIHFRNAMMYFSYEYNVSIWVFASDIPELRYFILYNNHHAADATKCARISMLEAKYIIPSDVDIPLWRLNEQEIEMLHTILNGKPDMSRQPTVWDWALEEYECQRMEDVWADVDHSLFPMPDYTGLLKEC